MKSFKSRFIEMFEGNVSLWPRMILSDSCIDEDDVKCGPFGTQLSKEDYTNTGIAVWGIPEINSEFKEMPKQYVSPIKAEVLCKYSVQSGDIVMSRKGNVGLCSVFPDRFDNGIIHSDVIRIRPNKRILNPIFLMNEFHHSLEIKKQIIDVSSGAIMPGINVTKLKKMEIYIPPIELQNRFSDFVKQVDKSKFIISRMSYLVGLMSSIRFQT